MPRIVSVYQNDEVMELYQVHRKNGAPPDAAARLTEATMVANALLDVAEALFRLGNADAASPMGGLEALGKAILEAHGK